MHVSVMRDFFVSDERTNKPILGVGYLTEHPHPGQSDPCHLDEEENSDVDNTDEDDRDQELEYSGEDGVPVHGQSLWGSFPGSC